CASPTAASVRSSRTATRSFFAGVPPAASSWARCEAASGRRAAEERAGGVPVEDAASPASTFRGRRRRIVLPEAELVSVRVLAGHEPSHVGDRHRLARLAAELPDTRRAGLDLVDVEVGARASLAGLHVRDRAAG